MCIYKLTWVNVKMWPLQGKLESWVHKSMVRDVLLLGHKQAFTWIDEWYGLTMEDIRKYEIETKVILDNKLKIQEVQKEAEYPTIESKGDVPEKKGWW